MQPFYKYTPSGRYGNRQNPRKPGLAKNKPRGTTAGATVKSDEAKKFDHKDIIAKAIKHASEKSELFRSKASVHDFKSGKLTAVKSQNQERSGNSKTVKPDNKSNRGGKRGSAKPPFKSDEPRLHTYKHRPRLKTGSDKDALTGQDRVKVIVLGGNEEVGRNMTLIEYKNDIVLIDMGLQFPEEDMPGVDYIIPNTSYLETKLKNIRGAIITHGHYDHIGAIPQDRKSVV